jgi:hypothetical protein
MRSTIPLVLMSHFLESNSRSTIRIRLKLRSLPLNVFRSYFVLRGKNFRQTSTMDPYVMVHGRVGNQNAGFVMVHAVVYTKVDWLFVIGVQPWCIFGKYRRVFTGMATRPTPSIGFYWRWPINGHVVRTSAFHFSDRGFDSRENARSW